MSRKLRLVSCSGLLLLIVFGVWISGIFGEDPSVDEISNLDVIYPLIGLLIVVSSLGGLFAILGRERSASSHNQMNEWAIVRAKGRKNYIVNFILRVEPIVLIAFSFPVLLDFLEGESITSSVRTSAIMVILISCCLPYLGAKFWDYNERKYGAGNSNSYDSDSTR